MSNVLATGGRVDTTNGGDGSRATRSRALRWGLPALAAAVAIIIYGAYGDPHPKSSQENAVPAMCAIIAVIAALFFAAVVPAGLRGMAGNLNRWSAGALGLAVVGLVAVPVLFWSGLPVVLGTGAALLGTAGRTASRPGPAKLPTAALVVGVLAIALDVVMVLLGNLVFS